eukprot:548766_1
MAVMRSVLRYIFLTIWCCYYCQSFHANPTVRVRSTMGTDVSSFGFQTSGDNLSKSIHVSTTHIASRLRIQIDRFIEIGTCDDLILDARSNYHLGGTNDSHYQWYIHDSHQQYSGVMVVIHNHDIRSLSNVFMVELSITHRDTFTTYKANITVRKSDADVIAKIELHGINQYTSTMDPLLNGKIDIDSSIVFENNTMCNNATNDRRVSRVHEYDISWSVAYELQNKSHRIESDRLKRLQLYLISRSEMNADSLSIDVHRMLQPGANYYFTMDVMYTSNGKHTQSTNKTHTLIYTQSSVQCGIMGDDIVLNDVSWPALTAFPLQFNGALFTYSPDDVSINDFDFEWECVDDMGNPCAYLLDDTDSGIVDIHLSALSRQNAFGFTLFMNIYNTKHEQVCSDSIGFHATILSDNDVQNALIVSATPIANRINADDKLRIIADIINKDRFDDRYEHRWFEVDGLLTDADVLLHSQTNHNSLNLVLKSNTLKAGHVYHFRLEVLRYNQANVLTQHGISSIIKIYVNAAVPIMDHSLLLSPECPNGEITYDSINDYIDRMNQYRVSVVVDSSATNVPLLYEFSHIQANMLSTPFEDHVQLYIGNNTLRAHVYDDALSVVTTASVQCRVMVTDDTQCIDELFDDLDLFLTDYDIYLYILQQSHLYLQYLFDYKPSDTQCVQEILTVVATTLNDHLTRGALCQSNFVILLSKVLQLWIDVALSDVYLMEWFVHTDPMRNLVFTTLDPCLYIASKNVSEMTVSTQSMIRNVHKIYYADKDITSYLSILQVNPRYHDLLYALTDSLLEWITITNDKQIFDLLSSALYIASLSAISTSIPGEQITIKHDSFSLFSSKISPYMNHDTIVVSIRNVTVYIPGDSISPSSWTHPVYVVMGAISQSKSDDCLKQTVSIAIIDDHQKNVRDTSNITLEFKCDTVCDDRYQCVSYNALSDVYHDCLTSINTAMNLIRCSCMTTTHATIHLTDHHCIKAVIDPFIFSDTTHRILSGKYWDFCNILVGCLWVVITLYILCEVYPFFKSKYLNGKHLAVRVMCLLSIISLFNLIACVIIYLINFDADTHQTVDILTALLLLSYNLYFVVYAIIFYTWFLVAHSMSPNVYDWKPIARTVLVCITITVTLLSWALYALTALNEQHHPIFNVPQLAIAAVWAVTISIITLVFIYYAVSVSRILFTTFVISSATQQHAAEDRCTAKKIFVINAFHTVFFVSQSMLSIFYTLHHHQFTAVILLAIVSVNLLFTISLLITYKQPLKRMILTETKRTYTINSWIKKHFNKDSDKNTLRSAADASRSNAVGRQSTIDMKHLCGHSTQMSFTAPSNKHKHQVTQSFDFPPSLKRICTSSSSGKGTKEEEKMEFDYEEIPHLTVYQCIKHSNAYPVFLQHCKKQYCADTLLAAIEFIQFQNQYNIQKRHQVKIPPMLELSDLIKDDSLSMRDKALALCKKYIVSGAEFELNISGVQKSDILKAMSELGSFPDDECALIFNDCVFGIVASMHDTFMSFQGTSYYQELKMNLFKEERKLKLRRAKAAETRVSSKFSRQMSLTPMSATPTPDPSQAFTISIPAAHAITFSRSLSGTPEPSQSPEPSNRQLSVESTRPPQALKQRSFGSSMFVE